MVGGRIAVYVSPKAGRNEIVGWRFDELHVRVTAPPDDGKANTAVCKVLATAIGVPKGAVSVVRGYSSRHKQLEVSGLDDDALQTALAAPGAGPSSLFPEADDRRRRDG